MSQRFLYRILWTLISFAGVAPLKAQAQPADIHYVQMTLALSLDSNNDPITFKFESASSCYRASKGPVSISQPGYILEYITETGEHICSRFELIRSPYSDFIESTCSISVPTDKNGKGYRIYKDGIHLWSEDIISPAGDLPISVQDLGTGKLRILPASVTNFYLSVDGGLHWEIAYRPELTPDWVYLIPHYDPLKVPKPLVRIDEWHKLRRQTFTYEVGTPPVPLAK